MREIMFRGKHVDRKKWVYGGYSLYPHTRFPCKPTIYEVDAGCWHPVEVIPETVGQYIGQTDKNGKKIFEGDILEDTPSWRKKREFIVVLFKETSFCTIDLELFRKNKLEYAYPIDDCDYGVCINMFEVVGNIHDNPELIGSDSNNGC